MKYSYANQFFFLHLISSSIWFCSIYKTCNTENNFGSYRQLIVVFFSLLAFLDKDVIYFTVKYDNKDFSLKYVDVEFCIYQVL